MRILLGLSFHEAENGEAALSLSATMPFDIVISDFNLPGKINGSDILDAPETIDHDIDLLKLCY